jgi:hypothetical protein
LDGTIVELAGFMFPYAPGQAHDKFLFAGFAYHCAICATRDLTQLATAEAAAPIPFTDAALTLRAQLELIEDPGAKLFYRLKDARIA